MKKEKRDQKIQTYATKRVFDLVVELAIAEDRNPSLMCYVLILEALRARGIKV
jgi:hypothetical protein